MNIMALPNSEGEHHYNLLAADNYQTEQRFEQLKGAAQSLALEAIHYRDSGKGEQFLTAKINKVLDLTK